MTRRDRTGEPIVEATILPFRSRIAHHVHFADLAASRRGLLAARAARSPRREAARSAKWTWWAIRLRKGRIVASTIGSPVLSRRVIRLPPVPFAREGRAVPPQKRSRRS